MRKDVSFLNKPIVKGRLESVPNNGYVLIDISRADFIDKDIIEVIEDFMLHAHLKNITVEIKRSLFKDQGFAPSLLAAVESGDVNSIRSHGKMLRGTGH